MNLVEVWVKNITSDVKKPNGYHVLVCDTDCYGNKRYREEITLSPSDYECVKRNGYYLG